MTITKIYKRIVIICLPLYLAVVFTSCEKFVEIEKAPSQLLVEDAYKEDATATSAVLNLYSNDFTTNSLGYFSFLGGIESDEMVYAFSDETALIEFQQAAVSITNITLADNLWANPYAIIRSANVSINELEKSTTLTPTLKNQLLGECHFFRAFTYFYLVNFFGEVPLALSGIPAKDAVLPRSSKKEVSAQIISDLKIAQQLLPVEYVSSPRSRANKYAATALLARVYLFNEEYGNAESEATKVIDATGIVYELPAPSDNFLSNSNEVIFQIMPTISWSELPILGTYYNSYQQYILAPGFVNEFESGDLRLVNWTNGDIITKNKLSGDESNIVLRLAEQYLIRAEARVRQDKISTGKEDLDAVRARAGLLNTTAAGKESLLNAILKERKTELFGEYSHRWFDLIRNGKANEVLSPLKPGWKPTAVLQPIPQIERLRNKTLSQNDGYPQ